jgi:CubicO group peptidase (beta-lactamase class C family)
MTARLAAFDEQLSEYVRDQIFCVGVQAAVSLGSEQWDVASGSAGPDGDVTPSSIWKLYCTAKPVVAVGIALLTQDGLLELDQSVGDLVGSLAFPAVTIRQLLAHVGGFHGLHGYRIGGLPYAVRDDMVRGLQPPAGWDPSHQAGYAEYAGWHLLGLAIESAACEPADAFLRREVCGPFARSEVWFSMPGDEYETLRPRLAVPYDLRGSEPVPMLGDRTRRACNSHNLSYGALGTARGLCSFYAELLKVLRGTSTTRLRAETLREFLQPQRGRRYDEILQRQCDFGLGFMVRLEDHGFDPPLSPDAFGHTGYFGASVALADPQHDLAVAIIWNGVVDGDMGIVLRRNAAIRALARDLIGVRVHMSHGQPREQSRPLPGGARLVASWAGPIVAVLIVTVSVVRAWATSGGTAVGAAVLSVGEAAATQVWLPWAGAGWIVPAALLVLGGLGLARVASVSSAHTLATALVRPDTGLGLLLLVFAGWLLWRNHRAQTGVRLDLRCPTDHGVLVVGQGGDRLVNHHASSRPQRFALDLTVARTLGPDHRPFGVHSLTDFLSFGHPLVSPIDGVVVHSEDGHDDLGSTDPATGNCVVIAADADGGPRVVVAHLRCGSVAVRTGDRVTAGQPIGEIGNSGNSSEPHLHIHAEDADGNGIPMVFGRRPLHRNDVLTRRLTTRRQSPDQRYDRPAKSGRASD